MDKSLYFLVYFIRLKLIKTFKYFDLYMYPHSSYPQNEPNEDINYHAYHDNDRHDNYPISFIILTEMSKILSCMIMIIGKEN